MYDSYIGLDLPLGMRVDAAVLGPGFLVLEYGLQMTWVISWVVPEARSVEHRWQ